MPRTFQLNVVFAPAALMRRLNRQYRGKDKVANVLSFLLDAHYGEIFLHSREPDLIRLYVHALLHLKGYRHHTVREAKRMEQQERRIVSAYAKVVR